MDPDRASLISCELKDHSGRRNDHGLTDAERRELIKYLKSL
jgi:hypothetical protein